MTHSRLHRLEKALLLLWFIANLTLGAFIVPAYGMSIDEPNNQRYATDTLNAYPSFFGTFYEPNYDSTYDGHGPAFVVIAGILVRAVLALLPDTFAPDLWHYSYFITFQLTGLCLYWLARRWFNPWTAWAVLMVFGTQPLLWGQAFINPKDVPFMFFFTLSVVSGFRMADRMEGAEPVTSLQTPVAALRDKLAVVSKDRLRRFLTFLWLALGIVLLFILLAKQMDAWIADVVNFLYTSRADSWAGRIFALAASPAPGVSVDNYVTKALRLFHRAKLDVLCAGVLFFLVSFGLLINDTTLSRLLRGTWRQWSKPGAPISSLGQLLRDALQPVAVKRWLRQLYEAFRQPRLLLAGAALGVATAVRAIAPWAGVIVVIYLVAKARSRAWPIAIAYFLVAGIVTYLAWPRLWDAPFQRYLEAVGIASNFRHFPGQVLFGGQFYGPADLPVSYLPVLLNIQFTEPVLVCIYVGLCLLAWQILQRHVQTDLLLYISLGFALPLLGLIVLRPPLYHNFRQVLFLIPAMFLLAAIALDTVLEKIHHHWARPVLIAILVLPGIYSAFRLHPYQYVYYNSLVGGTAGAYNRYELDYWRISLREMALELNEIAPEGAIIVVTRSAGLFARYARPDIIVDKTLDSSLDLDEGYDYLVQVARWERWDRFPDVQNIVVIERAGAVLVTAKEVRELTGR